MPMHKQQPFQEAELQVRVSKHSQGAFYCSTYLRNSIVRGVHSLKALLSRDADSNVRSLDHTDVVRAVTNSERHRTKTVLDEPDDKSLLQRGHTTADDAAALRREAEQQLLVRVVGERLWR